MVIGLHLTDDNDDGGGGGGGDESVCNFRLGRRDYELFSEFTSLHIAIPQQFRLGRQLRY